MTRRTRREFLEQSMFAAAAVAAGPLARRAPGDERPAGPNDVLRVAVIGVNSRGQSHLAAFTQLPDTEVVVICDPDESVGNKRCDWVEQQTHKRPAFVRDVRQVRDDRNIDVVSIATPNHWHALAAIWAIQAGKDVYVEKPVSHNVSEGRRIVDAARKYKRICQTGTQARSIPGIREMIQFVRDGGIGEVKLARALCYKRRQSIGPRGEYQVPASVDYDLWCGPAPVKPLSRQSFHYDWHWQWDYGNGDLGNQGIHQMDVARWGLGVSDLGQEVLSYGGRLGYEDAGETANTQVSVHDFGDKKLVFEVRGLNTEPFKGAHVGVVFYGSQGYVVVNHHPPHSSKAFDLDGNEIRAFATDKELPHYANFVEAVRRRDPEVLHADVLEGHLSSALCHLGNISYRLGDVLPASEVRRRLGGDYRLSDDCPETFERFSEHLKANDVNLEVTRLRLGAMLKVDGRAEAFTGYGSPRANALLTREYREGFEVPASAELV
ncbi:MAG: Gfo/Idh/MocA family protein [Planctomycetaceae bacterium]